MSPKSMDKNKKSIALGGPGSGANFFLAARQEPWGRVVLSVDTCRISLAGIVVSDRCRSAR